MNPLILILVVLIVLYLGFILTVRMLEKKWSKADLHFFAKNWKRIAKLDNQKEAILEADKLLDQMLKRKGYQGSLGDKLKAAANNFDDLNALWSAHKVRNKLAHELDYRLKDREFQTAMSGFRKAFRDLKLI